jgi:2-dehydro-3-deoxygalactonokinase
MTGELYGLLLQHSILSRSAKTPAVHDVQAFQRGLDVVFGAKEGNAERATDILSTLFSARTLTMTGQLEPHSVPDYLSGLMIGTEVAGFARRWLEQDTCPTLRPAVTICGDASLAARYAEAVLRTGATATLAPSDAAAKGLWRAAALAGLTAKEPA